MQQRVFLSEILMLVHNCRKPLKKLRDIGPVNFDSYKPAGLWVGIDGDWIRWCSSEQPDWIHPYFYEIDASALNLLWIRGEDGLLDFTKEYSMPFDMLTRDVRAAMKVACACNCANEVTIAPKSLELSSIAWDNVAAKFDGIVISPYLWSLRLRLHWYYGWDCASGCLWNASKAKFRRIWRPRQHPALKPVFSEGEEPCQDQSQTATILSSEQEKTRIQLASP